MELPLIITAFVVGGCVLALIGFLSYKAEQRRTETLGQLAGEMGFEFEPIASSAAIYSGLSLFTRGHSRKSKNVLKKSVRDLDLAIFDYQYVTGAGKSRQTHKLTVAVFASSNGVTPAEFELAPKNFWHSIGGVFGYQGIRFESHPNFATRYMLRGDNEVAVRSAFSATLLEFLESQPTLWSAESRARRLVVHRRSRIKPEEVRQFVADATRLALLVAPDRTE